MFTVDKLKHHVCKTQSQANGSTGVIFRYSGAEFLTRTFLVLETAVCSKMPLNNQQSLDEKRKKKVIKKGNSSLAYLLTPLSKNNTNT